MRLWSSEANQAKGIEQFSTNYKILVLASITIARAVYALNWYTISPGLAQISREFNVSTTGLGILESAFLLGAGIFQVPSTISATKWGAKRLCVAGMLLIGASNILCGLTNSFDLLIFLRFTLGIGASMFFAPAIAVVSRLFKNEKQGLAIGIYNSAYNVGGSVALFGWAYVDSLFGWRDGLIIGAVMAVALGIENYIVIRHSERVSSETYRAIQSAKVVLKNKQVWLFGIGVVGAWGTYYVVGQFLPFFEETVKSVPTGASSLLTAQIFIWPIGASLLGGYLSDRLRNRRHFMLFPSLALGITTIFLGAATFSESWLIVIVIGVADAFIFTALYACVYQMPELKDDQKIVSISLMNSVQITGAFIGPLLFTYGATFSYVYAWLAIGLFTIPFCITLVIAREPFKSANAN